MMSERRFGENVLSAALDSNTRQVVDLLLRLRPNERRILHEAITMIGDEIDRLNSAKGAQ